MIWKKPNYYLTKTCATNLQPARKGRHKKKSEAKTCGVWRVKSNN